MRLKLQKGISENRFILLAFVISALLVTAAYLFRHVFPFGDQTVLRVDLYHQYAPYIEELHSRILHGQSLLYSWEGGLGKDFAAQMAYYTTSPFNLLMFFFSEKQLPEMIALFILLKLSCCSSAFTWYLKSRYHRNDLSILIFGLLYGFCAFLTCYYWNIMWLDTVILFPFIIRGCEKLVFEGKTRLYYLALTAAMIVNFYLAVLVCIVTALYFLALVITKGSLDGRVLLRFFLASVLAAMSSLFILAPVATALSQTAVSSTAFPSFELYDNVWQLLNSHFLGARAAVLARNEDLPNIFSGVLTMVLLPAWFINPRIHWRRKLALGLIPLFLLLCSCIRPLDYLIHGMHFPANLPHRFTFMYSFLLLLMAYEAFQSLDRIRLRWLVLVCLLYAAGILATEYWLIPRIHEIDHVLSGRDILLNVGLMAAYLLLLYGYRQKQKPILALLLICVIGECAFSCMKNLEDAGLREAYVRYMDDAEQAVAFMEQQEEDGFYRAEFRRFTTINDASLYHYNGFSQFSSLEPKGISDFVGSLGIAATGNSFRYYDPTPLVDAIFDLKYVLNKDEPHPQASKYDFLKQFGTVWVYENPRCLSLAFMTDPKILDWADTDSQPFQIQNDFLRKAAGIEKDMFTMIEPDSISTEFITTAALSGETDFSYSVDAPEILAQEPSVSAVYTSDKDQYVYLYVNAGNAQRFIYRNDTVSQDRELSAGNSLIDVGHMSAGEKLYVEFRLTRRGAFEKAYRPSGTVSLYAAGYDDDVFQEGFDQLASEQLQITEHTDTRIEGNLTASRAGILFTSIPWSSSWECLVDGEKVQRVSIGRQGVIGLSLEPGEHRIVFVWKRRILLPAVLLSLLGILLAAAMNRHCSRSFQSIQNMVPLYHTITTDKDPF